MAGLLVSVRSADEAIAAVAGGATVIDVKEPQNGPLGRAMVDVWKAVRSVVPGTIPVSVALGELVDASDLDLAGFSNLDVSYRKIGPAGSSRDWDRRWADLRARFPGPPWVAVAYADFVEADALAPDLILEEALRTPDCVGVLVDTWDKSKPGRLDDRWAGWIGRARAGGRLVALAGRLDAESMARLRPLNPDLFAVRGAACIGGDRLGSIDVGRVRELARLAASVGV